MKQPNSKGEKLFRQVVAYFYLSLSLGYYRMAVAKSKEVEPNLVFFPFEHKILLWAFYDWEKAQEKYKNKVFTKEDFK